MQELLFGTSSSVGQPNSSSSSAYSVQKPKPVRPSASSAFSVYSPGKGSFFTFSELEQDENPTPKINNKKNTR
jgi:hypothetical protein